MKDYKRLTKRNADGCACYASPLTSSFVGAIYEEQKQRDDEILSRLAELEDKIESGELISPKDVGNNEIEFFVKHNKEVRKETAREIYNWLVEHSYDEESRQLVKAFHESFLEDE